MRRRRDRECRGAGRRQHDRRGGARQRAEDVEALRRRALGGEAEHARSRRPRVRSGPSPAAARRRRREARRAPPAVEIERRPPKMCVSDHACTEPPAPPLPMRSVLFDEPPSPPSVEMPAIGSIGVPTRSTAPPAPPAPALAPAGALPPLPPPVRIALASDERAGRRVDRDHAARAAEVGRVRRSAGRARAVREDATAEDRDERLAGHVDRACRATGRVAGRGARGRAQLGREDAVAGEVDLAAVRARDAGACAVAAVRLDLVDGESVRST